MPRARVQYPPDLAELDVDVGHGEAAVGTVLPSQRDALVVDEQELILELRVGGEVGHALPLAFPQVMQPAVGEGESGQCTGSVTRVALQGNHASVRT